MMVDFDSLKDDSAEQGNPPIPPSPPGRVPSQNFDELQDDSQKYGKGTEILKTALEQAASGATLGYSKVLETKLLGVKPDAIAGRESANPGTSTFANIGGTGALLAVTGGLGALGEGAGLATRVGLGALEGATIGGTNQANEDWSQNKPLDAQKIVASGGLGALLGGTGAGIAEGISRFTKVPSAVENQAIKASNEAVSAGAAPVDVPGFKGVKPTSFEDISNQVREAKAMGDGVPLPSQGELNDALSRVELDHPVNPLQHDSLSNQQARDIYGAAKETPGEVGSILSNYEGLQKAELVNKIGNTIKDISPALEPTSDAYQGGKYAIDAFTNQYQTEKEALAPIFKGLKNVELKGEILPDAITKMTEAVPGIANMFDPSAEEMAIRPYKTAWGIDKATYNAVREATESLQEEKSTLQTLWNVRKGLDQHVDVLAQGQAPREIRALKAALMDQMQESSGNPEIRDAFRRYAINEQQRQVIEKSFGASVGTPEFGQISKVKPEYIGDKIFGNTATVDAAKNILPSDQFQAVLGNWISEAKANATDKGALSSNKFGSFLRRNQDTLNAAFSNNPEQLQRLRDLVTISRVIPDSASINPSGTAKTLARMLPDILGNAHGNITWEGLLLKIPQKIASEISVKLRMNELNKFLSGQALKNSQESALKAHAADISNRIEQGVKLLFSGSASQARKAQ